MDQQVETHVADICGGAVGLAAVTTAAQGQELGVSLLSRNPAKRPVTELDRNYFSGSRNRMRPRSTHSSRGFAGRGFGMSTATGIIVAHGGALTVDSQSAQGTDVVVLPPAEGPC